MQSMNGRFGPRYFALLVVALTLAFPFSAVAQPKPAAISKFDSYVTAVEGRLEKQHQSGKDFLVPQDRARLCAGEQIIEQVMPSVGNDLPGAMLHHWRGTAFVPGATATDFARLMKDFAAYPKIYDPQVTHVRVATRQENHFQVEMRTRQKHVITVVTDLDLDVTFGRLDAQHGYSLSRSTKISEIDSPGTPRERALGPDENHGFLWRLNTYWSYEEADGGVFMQIETVSLSRSVPAALGWAIKPFVESVPRESLEFTLRSTCDALKK